jgi:hypothetical protein
MKAIGFHHHQEVLTKDDSPQLRGMLHQVGYLLKIEEAAEGAVTSPKSKPRHQAGTAKTKSVTKPAATAKAVPAVKAPKGSAAAKPTDSTPAAETVKKTAKKSAGAKSRTTKSKTAKDGKH